MGEDSLKEAFPGASAGDEPSGARAEMAGRLFFRFIPRVASRDLRVQSLRFQVCTFFSQGQDLPVQGFFWGYLESWFVQIWVLCDLSSSEAPRETRAGRIFGASKAADVLSPHKSPKPDPTPGS